jgi:hypothetical protein
VTSTRRTRREQALALAEADRLVLPFAMTGSAGLLEALARSAGLDNHRNRVMASHPPRGEPRHAPVGTRMGDHHDTAI